MKRQLITIAASALLFAGCSSVPSARNGKHSPATVADTVVVQRGDDEPAAPVTVRGARVAAADKSIEVANPTDGAGNPDFGGISGARSRSPVVATDRMNSSFATRRSMEIKNLAFGSEP